MGFLSKAKSFFHKSNRRFEDAASSIFKGAKSIINDADKDVVSVIKTAHQDIRDVVGGIGHIVNREIDTVNKTVSTVGNTVDKAASSFAWPLAIGAGLLGGILLLDRK